MASLLFSLSSLLLLTTTTHASPAIQRPPGKASELSAASAASAAAVASIASITGNPFGAAYPSLTGTALSAYISAQDAEYYSAVSAVSPSITGSALSAYISTGNAPITGTAASVESAALASFSALASDLPSAENMTDECGPPTKDPTVPDTCSTPVETSDGPAAYGVQCLNDTLSPTAVNISSCAILIPELCSNQWQHPGEWVWLTRNGCSIGSFLPDKNSFPQGIAQWPSGDQCQELIYASMVDSCQYAGVPWNIAAVNIKKLPSDESGNSGAAVNPLYGSYIVSQKQQRNFSDLKNCTYIPPGGSQTQTPCAALQSQAVQFSVPPEVPPAAQTNPPDGQVQAPTAGADVLPRGAGEIQPGGQVPTPGESPKPGRFRY